MGNRIIKETICTSDTINELSWFAEVLFYRLMVKCDDYGCFDGRPAIIKGSCFPLKDNVTNATITKAISELSRAGLLQTYEVNGRALLHLVKWDYHQRIRTKKHKYPLPEQLETTCSNLQQIAADCDELPPESEYESEYEYTSAIAEVCAEPKTAPAPPFITLTLNTGDEYPVTQADVAEYKSLYPAVDIEQQLRTMRGWLNDHPDRRKTKRGIKAFIGRWLAGEQDKGRRPQATQKPNRFHNFDERNTNYNATVQDDMVAWMKGENA